MSVLLTRWIYRPHASDVCYLLQNYTIKIKICTLRNGFGIHLTSCLTNIINTYLFTCFCIVKINTNKAMHSKSFYYLCKKINK